VAASRGSSPFTPTVIGGRARSCGGSERVEPPQQSYELVDEMSRVCFRRERARETFEASDIRVSLHEQKPEDGHARTKSRRKNPKALNRWRAKDFREKVPSLLGFLKIAVKTPCLPATSEFDP
jgi:hypothetical protein